MMFKRWNQRVTISFLDTNLGQYTFTLLEALDHVDGLASNDLSFDLPCLRGR